MGKNGTASQKKVEKLSPLQYYYKKLLEIGTCFLVLMHFLIAQTRYIHPYYYTTRPVECWFLVILIVAAVIYLILSRTIWQETSSGLQDFFRKFRNPCQIICFIFFFWYILTCLVNSIRYSHNFFLDNDWWLLDTAVNCIIIFSLPMVVPEEKAKKLIHVLLHIIALAGTVFAVYCLRRLFLLDFVVLENGSAIGMTRDMKLYMGSYYNISSANQLCIVLVCIYLIASQKLPLKILYGAAMLINTYALILNNSRAAFVSCMTAYALAVFLAVWNLVKKPAGIRWAAGLGGAAVSAGILWILRPFSFQVFEDITHFSEILAAQSEITGPVNQAIGYGNPAYMQYRSGLRSGRLYRSLSLPVFFAAGKNGRKKFGMLSLIASLAFLLILFWGFVYHESDFSSEGGHNTAVSGIPGSISANKNAYLSDNAQSRIYTAGEEGEKAVRKMSDPMNRSKVWESAVNVIKSDPITMIFGVTPTAVSDALRTIGGANANFAHAHNEVLQMGVSMGVPMMILFVVFIIFMIIKSIRLGMIEGSSHFRGAYMIPVIMASLLVLTLAEAYLFAYFSLMSSLFFLSCGWVNALTFKNSEKKGQK